MISYPFDPQCRLESNWIKNEQLRAFPSSATRTVVPLHAPFFFKDAVLMKGNQRLVEGVHFYYSLKHKAASFANAMDVYGGITLIDDAISLPITVSYHPLGGSFEATAGQIKLYLDTAPDIWDGSWEALIVNSYYPPVNILFDPEQFVSEPEIIAACKGIEAAIKSKDPSDTMSYQLYATRIRKLREDLEKSPAADHIAARGNVHNTQPFHVNALAADQPAKNTKRLEGADLTTFTQLLIDGLGSIETLIAGKIKNGDVGVWNSKFLLSGGSLLFGDTTSLYMDDEGIAQNGDNGLTLIADRDAMRPGTKATLKGGGNELAVKSTGNVQDSTTLYINDVEAVTEATLKAYVNGILSNTGFGFTAERTESLAFSGAGTRSAPLEANPTIPPASETAQGIVKVVNEGSHGNPCPGYGGQNFYAWFVGDGVYTVLRNGADDLEHDVFLNKLTESPFKFTPSADRFRPKNLPVTAKPTYVRHGTEDCVWLDTTDGPFILLTNRNPDHNTWRCLKITNADMNHGYYGCPFLVGNKLYAVKSWMVPGGSGVQLWEATVQAGNTVTFTQRTLVGNNNNGTPQNGLQFNLFDKMVGQPGEKAYVINVDGFFGGLSVSHAGDQFDHVQKGKLVRFNHNGWFWAGNAVTSTGSWNSMSYTLDLETGVVTPDSPEIYPLQLTRNGMNIRNPRSPLRCQGGNHTVNGVRTANGKVLAFQSYGRLYTPQLMLLENLGVEYFENAKWNQQYYQMPGAATFLGSYAGPVHSGIRGVFPLAGNRMIGLCMDGFRVRFKYDPSGSYAPNAKGYGPTNDRVQLHDSALHDSLARMTWYFDGDTVKQAGTLLADRRLSNNSTYADDELGTPVSISAANHAALKQQAISKYASQHASVIIDSKLTLGIHRAPGMKMLGMLQILRPVTGDNSGRKQFDVYVFEITTRNTVGEITTVGLGNLLYTWVHNNTADRFVPEWERYYYSNSGVFRLDDGGYLVMLAGEGGLWVGNGGSPSIVAVFDANGNYLNQMTTSVNTVTGEAWIGTKELGFGITSISDSGEGLYLNSYGRTTAEVLATIARTRTPEVFIIVLSRSDAGDNVAISQYAANVVRNKVLSMIPPTRKVQNMDLSQDRVITRAMLPAANNVPNQRDSAYPVQQKHQDSLQSMALKTHTHPTGDFVLNVATTAAYGAAKLGTLTSPDTDAFSAIEIDKLEDIVDSLQARTVSLNQLDATLTIDYEV